MDKAKFIRAAIDIFKKTTPYVVVEEVYRKMFNHHINCYDPLTFQYDDFPELEKERYEFKSGKNLLVGYVYKNKNLNPDKLLVFSHGYGGGGQRTYLDLINAFCDNNFYVFAYDATANDESQGDKMRGFTQGYIDADNAMTFIENLKKYKNLPIYAAGHSWGAFSSSSAIGNHKKIKGLIAFSGFNSPTSVFKSNGNKYAGEDADKFMPYVDSYEEFLFGKDSKISAIESFKKTKARIVIVQSEDDNVVLPSAGYNDYVKEFKHDSRFKFIKLKNKGHGTVYYTDKGKEYYDSFNKYIKQTVKAEKLDDNGKKELINKTLNKSIYTDMVDKKLIKKAIDFILDN